MIKLNSRRNSNIELLKIIAIIMIIFSHSGPYYGSESMQSYININISTINIQEIILVFYRYLGQLGNDIFIICSAYYLLESHTVKSKKVFNMIMDSFFISIIFLGTFLNYNYEISIKEIFINIFPVTFANNWFVTVYILLYIIHPFLNIIIHTLEKERLLYINIFIIIVYCGIQFILPYKYFYNLLVGFISIYFMVAYSKYYLHNCCTSINFNKKVLIVSSTALILLILSTNSLGLRIGILSDKLLHWCTLINPFILLIAFSLFNLFKRKSIFSKRINYVSSLSLFIYLIHENMLFRRNIRPYIYQFIYDTFSYDYILIWTTIIAMVTLLISIIAAVLYKEIIRKLLQRVSDFIYEFFIKVGSNIFKYLMKFD